MQHYLKPQLTATLQNAKWKSGHWTCLKDKPSALRRNSYALRQFTERKVLLRNSVNFTCLNSDYRHCLTSLTCNYMNTVQAYWIKTNYRNSNSYHINSKLQLWINSSFLQRKAWSPSHWPKGPSWPDPLWEVTPRILYSVYQKRQPAPDAILGPKIQKRCPFNQLVERYGPLVDACQTENQWTGTDRYKTSVKPTSGPIHSNCINIRPSEGLSDPTQPQQRTHFTPAMKMRPMVETDCPHIALITTAPTRTRIYRFSKNHYASLPHENQFTHLWNPKIQLLYFPGSRHLSHRLPVSQWICPEGQTCKQEMSNHDFSACELEGKIIALENGKTYIRFTCLTHGITDTSATPTCPSDETSDSDDTQDLQTMPNSNSLSKDSAQSPPKWYQ